MPRAALASIVALALVACGPVDAVDGPDRAPPDAAPDADADPVDAEPDADAAPDAAPDAALDAAPDAAPDLGPLPGPVERARSLVWLDPTLLDDPDVVSLARVMAAAADDGHGGRLLDRTLRRFGTTPFSVRRDQARIADDLRAEQGDDPADWDLTRAPFVVTGVHLRLDLAAGEGCGELRVSLSTTHATVQPLHLIFLFEMRPEPRGRGCRGLAVRLARLSELSDPAFYDAARALLDEHLVAERFLLMESAEFTTFPWEWRQWVPTPNDDPETVDALPVVLENPPLFQTVDTEGLNNAGGTRRRAFIDWVEANAAAIDARTAVVPEAFRAPFATAPTAVPRAPLSLRDLDPAVARRYPRLRQNLEIMGCPVCHTADAEFVQTLPDRSLSDFYDKELDARAAFMDAWVSTGEKPPVPYGPLQPDPVLPD